MTTNSNFADAKKFGRGNTLSIDGHTITLVSRFDEFMYQDVKWFAALCVSDGFLDCATVCQIPDSDPIVYSEIALCGTSHNWLYAFNLSDLKEIAKECDAKMPVEPITIVKRGKMIIVSSNASGARVRKALHIKKSKKIKETPAMITARLDAINDGVVRERAKRVIAQNSRIGLKAVTLTKVIEAPVMTRTKAVVKSEKIVKVVKASKSVKGGKSPLRQSLESLVNEAKYTQKQILAMWDVQFADVPKGTRVMTIYNSKKSSFNYFEGAVVVADANGILSFSKNA